MNGMEKSICWILKINPKSPSAEQNFLLTHNLFVWLQQFTDLIQRFSDLNTQPFETLPGQYPTVIFLLVKLIQTNMGLGIFQTTEKQQSSRICLFGLKCSDLISNVAVELTTKKKKSLTTVHLSLPPTPVSLKIPARHRKRSARGTGLVSTLAGSCQSWWRQFFFSFTGVPAGQLNLIYWWDGIGLPPTHLLAL